MRLSQDKIHDLANQVVAMMREHPKINFNVGEDALRVAVGSGILDDLREEAEIDAEVDALMSEHSAQILKEDLDGHSMRLKFKQQIAKQRGFTL